MATQLKASDYQHIYVPAKPAQHIRVAFVDAKAQQAVTAALSTLPASFQAATLDDLASWPLRTLLSERNALIDQLNRGVAWTPEQDDAALSAANKFESAVLNRPALTPDDAVIKLIAVAQVGAEGHEVGEEEAARAIMEARSHFGIGYVHEGYDHLDRSGASCLRNGASADHVHTFFREYDAYAEARRERVKYENEVYRPTNPLITDPVQLRFDDLVDAEFQALMRLLKTPAPTASELAIKLQLLEDDRWIYHQFEEVSEQLIADARAAGGRAAEPNADRQLLAHFAALRADTADYLSDRTTTKAEDDQADSVREGRMDAVARERAVTLDGVLAKLRLVFPAMAEAGWADHARVDPSHRDFVAGLSGSCFYSQLLWSGIEDLARIAAVNLAEQGA